MPKDALEGAQAECPAKPPLILGVRASALRESVIFIGIALLVDTFLFSSERFSTVDPHPFWLIVLLTSSYYGTSEGLLAAAMATAALLIGNLPEQAINEDLAGWLLRVTKEPVLWFGTALVLGEMSRSRRQEIVRLGQEACRLGKQADDIARAYEDVAQSNSILERRIASQRRTLRNVVRGADVIERATKAEVVAGIPELVRRILAPRKFSLFLQNGGALELSVEEGWQAGDPFWHRIDQGPLFAAMAGGHKVLVVSNPEQEAMLCGQGVMAAPLKSRASGELIGMLKVEELDFFDLNPATVMDFRVLCDWIGSALDRAEPGSGAIEGEVDWKFSAEQQGDRCASFGDSTRQRDEYAGIRQAAECSSLLIQGQVEGRCSVTTSVNSTV